MGTLEERKLKEIQHSDRRRSIVTAYEYRTDAGADRGGVVEDEEGYAEHFSNMKFYSVTRTSTAYRDALLRERLVDATALDYCCGNGEVAIEMARQGARHVVGIDLSEVAIKNAQVLASKAGVADRCEFKVMDAENMTFPVGMFDVIHEYGALHHLELRSAFRELSRVMKPTGKLVCTETLRHNPFIHLYRRLTPHLRTEWEVQHILGFPELKRGRQFFGAMTLRTFHLAALAAVPLRKTGLFNRALKLLEGVDDGLLALPLIDRMAWVAVVKYEKPMQ